MRDRRVNAETSPAARASRAPPPPAGLTLPLNAGKLSLCRLPEEEASGSTSCVGPEADASEPQEPGPQPEEPLPAQDPGEEAACRHLRGERERGQEAPARDGGRDRPRRQEGRRSR